MKKLISILLLLSILLLIYFKQNEIQTFISKQIRNYMQEEIIIKENNEYTTTNNFELLQNTKDFTPKNFSELLNIYYTVLNNGWTNFTFNCDFNYKTCIKDLKTISNDEVLLTNISNFVHPYNSYNTIKTTYDNYGNVKILINKKYTKEQIELINQQVEKIYTEKIKNTMSNRDKIKIIHDYIIKNSIYDQERAKNFISIYRSDIAYGPLIEGYAICMGYADAMKLFLDKMDIKNYKISSQKHVWNLVELENNWYHLDLTWDDPIISNGAQMIDHTYFLITTNQLEKIKKSQENKAVHIYNKLIFKEAK